MSRSYTVKLPGRSPVTLTAAGFCAPCEASELQAQTAAVQETYQVNEGASTDAASSDYAWEGVLGYEGEFTGDGRFINKGALFFDEAQLPMPLRWAPSDVGAHGGAQVIGLIQSVSVEAGSVKAYGIIDSTTALGAQVVSGLQRGTIKGVSLDLDDTEIELRVKREIYDAVMEPSEPIGEHDMPEVEEDENGYVKVAAASPDDEVIFITKARIRAATLVDIPAFANAYVSLVASGAEQEVAEVEADAPIALVAAAVPVNPPAAWFSSELDEPTPLTFTEDGRVFGHIALWGTCHTGYAGSCVTPPYSATNYAWFRTGALFADDGTEIAVGHITMDTGHAPAAFGAAPAAAHYDDTGTVVADVASGEDRFGIWVAGALRPGLSAEQLRSLRSAPMSGDWRMVGGNLELVGVLAVNLPGFPVPRTKALVASGRTTTLLSPVPSIEISDTEVVEEPKEPSKVAVFAARAQELAIREWTKEVGE